MSGPGSEKSPDAFRTISEVAEDLDLPQHVLRFWETRFTQIKPMKRGGGRRYYRPDDVDLLRGIRLLLYGEGFTIRGVQRLLKERGVGFVAEAGRTGSIVHAPAPARNGEPTEGDASPERREPVLQAPPAAPEPAPVPPAAEEVPDEPDATQDDEPVTAGPVEAAPRGGGEGRLGEAERRALGRALADLAEARRLLEEA